VDHKIALLFVLIGAIIGLSHLSDERVAWVKRHFAFRGWRPHPARRKV
jgi:hypothetical protein